MATINDFKLVNKYSEEYFKNINTKFPIHDSEKRRLGFYLLILECITGNTNYDELQESIIDTEFCSHVYGENNTDLGIDAVYIDDEEKAVKLFNFKFKENFKDGRGQNERNLLDCSKFWMKLDSQSFSEMTPRTREKAELIHQRFESNEIWETELFLISNDNIRLGANNSTLKDFKNTYAIKVTSIVLDDIIGFISDRPDDLNAKFVIDSNSVLTYEENSVASQKSYVVKLPIDQLIRITCNDLEMRNNESLSDLSELSNLDIELGFLYDNVREYLGDTKYNKNIINTLKEEPSKFFMFNNGITITAENIIMRPINGNKKYSCAIENFQIVNGGQTLRSIYRYKDEDFNEENLAKAEVLVRIFKTEVDEELTNDIAEYTNSQNAISPVDLKSISNLQVKLEKYLAIEDIDYIRKSGDVKAKGRDFTYRISMERLAQIIYSYNGYPYRATNAKRKLFGEYYDEIFDSKNIEYEFLVKLVKLYKKVEESYSTSKYSNYNQKYLYVIYLKSKYPDSSIDSCINVIESTLKDYRKEEDISDSRKLIQKGFQDSIDKNASKTINTNE